MNRCRLGGFLTSLAVLLALAAAIVGCSSYSSVSERADVDRGSTRTTGVSGAAPTYKDDSVLIPTPGSRAEAQRQSSQSNMSGKAKNLAAPQRQSVADLVAPGSLPSKDEELWVIEKRADGPVKDDQAPGSGALLAKLADKPTESVAVPLKHTDVKASIAGYIATVDVTQQFTNPYKEKIEAQYVFPLPHNAAVNEFVMTVGERKIRGIIRERAEAERIYGEARRQGYVASLLTQERPNIFTQSVANIEPGKQIDINVRYFHTLSYTDGWYEFVFPMVVGPRFNPPGSTQGVGAVGRNQRGASRQATEVQYLRPHERSGHDIGLSVHVEAGVEVEQVECKTHKVAVNGEQRAGQADVKLASSDSIPNRDFVLRYKVAGKTIKSAVMVQRDPKEKDSGWFTLMLYPPETMNDLPRKPLEMVFTIDVSGSQSGVPIAQEKAAVKYALRHLDPQDTFQVIRFGNTAIKLFPQPMPADDEHVAAAIPWIDALEAKEGTMLVDALRASLIFSHDPSRLRYVTFLTDGFIGNESDALAEIARDLGPSRIFSFGSGSSTNRYLLEHMAKLGNGAAAYLGPRDDADQVMATFLHRISRPAMTDLALDFGGMPVSDVYPARLPDLYVGRPVTITGRFTGGNGGDVRVKGMIAGERREIPVVFAVNEGAVEHKGIGAVWARMKIADLADRAAYEAIADLPQQIKQVALDYGLMSSFTAFVAVDSSAKTAGDHGTTVAVPVPVPEGIRYETTVGER